MTTMMRVNPETHATLHELAVQRNTTMQEVLTEAVEAFRREQLIEATNAAYAALRADESAWRGYQAEIAGLDGVLMDGLDVAPAPVGAAPSR